MNFIDIIVALILLIAAVGGWRSGMTRQLFSIAGLIIGYILAKRFAITIGSLIGLSNQWALIAGFIVVFIVVIIASGMVGGVVQKIFHAVGLGIVDNLLGAALSALKVSVILLVLFAVLMPILTSVGIISMQMVESSRFYNLFGSFIENYSFDWIEHIESPSPEIAI